MIRNRVSAALPRYLNTSRTVSSTGTRHVRTMSTVGNKPSPSKEHLQTNGISIPFSRSQIGPFFQEQPKLGNQFLEDVTLRSYLKRVLPEEVLKFITPDLERFGNRVATDIYDLHLGCERDLPSLQQYDPWGKRVDNVITCDSWKQMKRISAQEGLIAIAYERKYGPWSRLYQVAKLYLYGPSAGLFLCPLAMTDGASKILEGVDNPHLKEHAYNRLISRNPDNFWTSGQWMTERKGGSDVADGTETLAVAQRDGSYRLYGYKWFTSALDSDMAITLARIVDENGQVTQGSRGLTMFYLENKDKDGNWNSIEIERLKDKVGTKQLPTAELLLDGSISTKISEDGRGVASIADMLNITRLYNSLSAAAGMRRMINLVRDYSHKRVAFGKLIKDHSLHIKHVANMEIEQRAGLLLVLEVARLLGKQDCGVATPQDLNLLRLLTTLTKLYTGKQGVAVASEGLECFGGMGYLEDTDLPRHLRDAQVLPIWEGTTNVLSLDTLRTVAKSGGKVLVEFTKEIEDRTKAAASHPQLKNTPDRLNSAANDIIKFASEHTDELEVAARDFAYSLVRTYMGMLLVEHACWSGASEQDILVAQRWCERDLTPVITDHSHGNYDKKISGLEYKLVMDGYVPTVPSKL